MRKIINNILYSIGTFLRVIGYTQLIHCCRSMRDRIYTGIYKNKFQKIGNSCIVFPASSIIGPENIKIGDDCTFEKGIQLEAWGDKAIIEIGNNCLIRANSHITAYNSIVIEDGLLTGNNVLISDNSHGNIQNKEESEILPLKRTIYSKGGIHIEKNVWIGNNVCILSSVNIGKGAIIGANSVVTHDVPPYCVAAGNPARIIKKLI